MEREKHFVIIGGGQSGGWAAKTLRDQSFEGRIVLVGNEMHPPYERPPLSKELLVTEKEPSICHLWSAERFDALGIDHRANRSAVHIDRDGKEVVLSDGVRVRYDRLLLATGARPRRLERPGSDLPGIHYLRTIDDCLRIRRELTAGSKALIVGGGWIGLEVAASAMARGAQVTLVEVGGQLCGRSLPASSAAHFLELHRSRGVDVRLGVCPVSFEGTDHVERVALDDGSNLEVSTVIIGIGVEPNVELAAECGLEVGNGIVVDALSRTSDPDIFACGDVANREFGASGERLRFETWQNAQVQGIAAAKAMLGAENIEHELPWFWSDQYDLNFQMIGMPAKDDEVVVKGDPNSGKFVEYFLRDERLTAAAAYNNPRELRDAKRMMKESARIDRAALSLMAV